MNLQQKISNREMRRFCLSIFMFNTRLIINDQITINNSVVSGFENLIIEYERKVLGGMINSEKLALSPISLPSGELSGGKFKIVKKYHKPGCFMIRKSSGIISDVTLANIEYSTSKYSILFQANITELKEKYSIYSYR